MFGLKKKKAVEKHNYPLRTGQEFYNFIKTRNSMSDRELVEEILVVVGETQLTGAEIGDLVQATRHAIAEVKKW